MFAALSLPDLHAPDHAALKAMIRARILTTIITVRS